MEDGKQSRTGERPDAKSPACQYELHIRLCARRGPSGHLDFKYRVEHLDNIAQEGDSLEGRFPPFNLPHENGQEVAAVVRNWQKEVALKSRERATQDAPDPEGEQLTLRGFLAS